MKTSTLTIVITLAVIAGTLLYFIPRLIKEIADSKKEVQSINRKTDAAGNIITTINDIFQTIKSNPGLN